MSRKIKGQTLKTPFKKWGKSGKIVYRNKQIGNQQWQEAKKKTSQDISMLKIKSAS